MNPNRQGKQPAGIVARTRGVARTFADHIAMYGGRPLAATAEPKIIGGPSAPLWVSVAIPDNATTSVDLRNASLWDRRVQSLFGSAATPLKAVVHIEGFALYINDADFLTETALIKAGIDEAAYLKISANGNTQEFPLRGRIYEPFHAADVKQAVAADDVTATFNARRPYLLERPLRVDLEVDTFSFEMAAAVNYVGTAIGAYLEILGTIAPKGVEGADGVSHGNVGVEGTFAGDVGGAHTKLAPLSFANLNAAWLARMLGI